VSAAQPSSEPLPRTRPVRSKRSLRPAAANDSAQSSYIRRNRAVSDSNGHRVARQSAPSKYPDLRQAAEAPTSGQRALAIVVKFDAPHANFGKLIEFSVGPRGSDFLCGVASNNFWAREKLTKISGSQAPAVPYKGSNFVVADILEGVLGFGALPVEVANPLVRSGKLRLLAVIFE
jgi:hypothetical protein